MSRNYYRVYLNKTSRRKKRINKSIITALNELNARRVSSTASQRVQRANWNPISNSDGAVQSNQPPAFDPPKELYELDIPKELTEPYGISNERVLISIDKDKMDILLTDASMPAEKCGEIVAEVVSKVYEKATGKRLDRSQVAIRPYARLSGSLCEHCLESVDGQPYRCRVCGRCFCYLHRAPETHGCVADQKNTAETMVTAPIKSAKAPVRAKPKLILQRVPCG